MEKAAIMMMRRTGGNFGKENDLFPHPILEERGLNITTEKVSWMMEGLV